MVVTRHGSQVTVPESVPRIHQLLVRAARRYAWLAFARGFALAVASLSLGLTLATVAVNEGARSAARLALGVASVAAIGLVLRRLRGLRARIAPRGQAEVVEQLRPELRGGLLTVVDRAERPLGSAGLFVRLADDVSRRVEGLRPTDIWPGRPLWLDSRWGVLALALLALAAMKLPLGPIDALKLVFGTQSASASVTPVVADGPHALLGDITLRYEYPTYTRLDPLEVPNTSGEVHAPPGTVVRIRARTAQAWESATLEVSGAAPVPAELVGGRDVSGSFTVGEAGTWDFRFGELASPSYRIVPDPDLAPVVAVKAPASSRVAVDDTLLFAFNAKDDYGITKVVLELTVNGRVREEPLRVPLDAPRTLADAPAVTASSLGLHLGDVARVRVGAWDNDEVSGSKVGWSSAFTVEIGGAGGSSAASQKLREELFDALVPLLADFLVDPTPLGETAESVSAWSDAAEERYVKFDKVASAAEGYDGRTFEARQIDHVNSARRDLFAFVRGLPAGLVAEKDGETLARLQGSNVRALEMAVWSLDARARAEAYRKLQQLVEELAQEAKELRDELPNLTSSQALARLDQLTRLESQVKKVASQLDKGSIRAFLESRGAEVDGALAAARRDIAAQNDPAARADMKRVADLLDEMAGGVKEAQERQQGGGDELKKEIEALKQELSSLAEDQSALQKKTDAARDEHGQSLEEGLAAWKRVDASTKAAKSAMADPSVDKGSAYRPYAAASEDAKHDASGLDDSARARDVQTSLERAEDLEGSLSRARERLKQAARTRQVSAADAAQADAALSKAQRSAESARQELEALSAAQSQGSPELSRALQELSKAQQQLGERADKTAERAKKVAHSMPSDASELEEATAEGAEQAKRAAEAMQEGDAMGASGGQQAAEDAFERAQEALEQALEDAKQMQAGGGSGDQSEGDQPNEPSDQGDQGSSVRQEVTIPAPEEFETPEAYRKALLEGMQGDIPEAYRATNKRYYEELVRQ